MKWLRNINSFEAVYLAISIATFTHTTWAAATVIEGHQPDYVQLEGLNPDQILGFVVTNFDYFSWVFAGALIAVAVDCGMLIAARELSKRWNWMVLISFVIGAIASFYTQLTYSLYHTGTFTYSSGVTDYWLAQLTPLIDARVIVIPLILPLFAIVYTFARISAEQEQQVNPYKEELNYVAIEYISANIASQQQKQAGKTVKIKEEQLTAPFVPLEFSTIGHHKGTN